MDKAEDWGMVSGSYKHDTPCLLQMKWETKYNTKNKPKKQNKTKKNQNLT